MTRRKPKPVTLAPVPSLDAHRHLAFTEVPDPFEPGRKIVVAKNVLAHPAELLFANGRIDEAQRMAGARVMSLYERAEIGGSAAIDYSRVRVDGGILADPLAEAVHEARRALLGVRQAVGVGGYAILMPVMGEGIHVHRLVRERPALARGLSGKRAEGYITGRLREALDDLVQHWGLIAVGGRSKRVRSERGLTITGPQAEWEIGGRFGDLQPVEPKKVGILPTKPLTKGRKAPK